jgi:7-cyano-7-deazaguanine reductase
MTSPHFSLLGHTVATPQKKLETFPASPGLETVVLESDEVTSLCPVTGQPDWETVRIEFAPEHSCLESKSLKLYLWSFRDQGVFCEALATQIAADVFTACAPRWVRVTVTQKPRGGITIRAEAKLPLA